MEGQVFIYTSIIEGESLQERLSDMNGAETQSDYEELKHMVEAWRTLEQ
jgi:hypothetical protein